MPTTKNVTEKLFAGCESSGLLANMLTDLFYTKMATTKQNGTTKDFETKSISFAPELKVEETDGKKHLFVEGYAAIFGNKDSYGDIVEQGAFSETLSKAANRVKFCYNHDLWAGVCGKVLELKEDLKGLWFKAEIIPTSLGADVSKLIEYGAIDEMSIGYRTKEYRDAGIGTSDQIRHILKAELLEISVVSRAANPLATITATERKSEQMATDVKSMTNAEIISLERVIREEKAERTIKQLNFKN